MLPDGDLPPAAGDVGPCARGCLKVLAEPPANNAMTRIHVEKTLENPSDFATDRFLLKCPVIIPLAKRFRDRLWDFLQVKLGFQTIGF